MVLQVHAQLVGGAVVLLLHQEPHHLVHGLLVPQPEALCHVSITGLYKWGRVNSVKLTFNSYVNGNTKHSGHILKQVAQYHI